jgi:hypothetical protein
MSIKGDSPLTLILDLVQTLHEQGIRYCHWKSNRVLACMEEVNGNGYSRSYLSADRHSHLCRACSRVSHLATSVAAGGAPW